MEQAIQLLTAHPEYLLGVVILVAFLLFSLIKKLIKLIFIAVILLILYGVFLYEEGTTMPEPIEMIQE